MKQDNIYTSTQVNTIMDAEFEKFKENNKSTYGIFEHQAVRDFMKQVKDKLNETQTNLA